MTQNKPEWEKEIKIINYRSVDKLTTRNPTMQSFVNSDCLFVGDIKLKSFISDQIKQVRIETLKECLPLKMGKCNEVSVDLITQYVDGFNACRKQILSNAEEKYNINL